MTSAMHHVEVVDVTEDEAFALFDRVCQERLGMSGSEFVEHFQAGKFDGIEADSMEGLSKILAMLPFAGLNLR